jgi:hypothetical protein
MVTVAGEKLLSGVVTTAASGAAGCGEVGGEVGGGVVGGLVGGLVGGFVVGAVGPGGVGPGPETSAAAPPPPQAKTTAAIEGVAKVRAMRPSGLERNIGGPALE